MLSRNKRLFFFISVSLAIGILVAALLAPLIAPHDPLATNFESVLEEPNEQYPLGTDHVGRCVYSRILYGAQISISITLALLCMVSVLGLIIGVTAGMAGGVTDTVVMRTSDVVLSFPDIIFAIAIVGILGPGIFNTILALSLIWWTKYARLTRILVVKAKAMEYVDAGKMTGASTFRLVGKYILPNIISLLSVQVVIDIGHMMLAIATLSFLGLGIQSPTPEWGNMLNEGRDYIQTKPWLITWPGLAIFTVVAIFNLLGDTLRDWLDPK